MTYQESRDALIPAAMAFANRVVCAIPNDDPEKDLEWNRAYLTKMVELAKAEGLTPWRGDL